MAGYYGVTREFNSPPTLPGQVGRGLSLNDMTTRYGSLNTNTGLDRVVQSMQVILSTKKGSRLFNPSFGSHLHNVLFDNNIFSKRSEAEIYAKEAIQEWEPRVHLISVEANPEQELGKVGLKITFRIKGDNGLHETQFSLTEEGGMFDGYAA